VRGEPVRMPRSAVPWLRPCLGAVALLSIAASILLVARPAGADVNTVTGSAFGISGPSGSSGAPGAPMPGGVSGTASDPAAGFGPIVGSAHLIGLPGVLTVDDLQATTSGVITPGTHARLATAAASVQGLSVAGGLVTAGRVSS